MQLNLDYSLCEEYKSNTQKMRVATEKWVEQNMFCPICGRPHLHHYTANKPVADFCCEECKNDFELKSKNQDSLGKIINDGAYDTMMTRLNDLQHPYCNGSSESDEQQESHGDLQRCSFYCQNKYLNHCKDKHTLKNKHQIFHYLIFH